MIIFVGSEEKGFFVEDVGKVRLHEETAYVRAASYIETQVNDILAYGQCSYLVFDIEQYHNKPEELAEEIVKLKNTNNAEIVILAPGYSMKSEVIIHLKEKGVKYFITEVVFAEQKDIFEKCINGYYEKNNLAEESKIDVEREIKEEKKVKFQGKFVGVAGACHRIGTTTQALQITKYFIAKGYKACYIQMNESSFWRDVCAWYNCSFIDPELGLIQFQNVDIFYRQERLPDVLRLDYDYFVYDFGVYTDSGFNKLSFLEKHTRIVVTGSFPTEMSYTKRVLENDFYKDVSYIFSFIEEKEQKELISQLGGEFQIFFAEEVRDPFILKDMSLYEKIIPLKEGKILVKKKRGTKRKEKKKDEKYGGIKEVLGRYLPL